MIEKYRLDIRMSSAADPFLTWRLSRRRKAMLIDKPIALLEVHFQPVEEQQSVLAVCDLGHY